MEVNLYDLEAAADSLLDDTEHDEAVSDLLDAAPGMDETDANELCYMLASVIETARDQGYEERSGAERGDLAGDEPSAEPSQEPGESVISDPEIAALAEMSAIAEEQGLTPGEMARVLRYLADRFVLDELVEQLVQDAGEVVIDEEGSEEE